MGPVRKSLEERFWPKVEVRGPDECWPWTASTSRGYGQIGLGGSNGRPVGAHRVAYELSRGPIPSGMDVDHLCHNGTECREGSACAHRRCCNPTHLGLATRKINVLRGEGLPAQNLRKTHCQNGHPFDEGNTVWTTEGTRYCRRCNLDWQRARRVAAGAGVANKTKTHCPRGHPYDEGNTRWRGAKRECKACDRERARERYRAKKAPVRVAEKP